ncbi:MAG: IS110 family transposase [Tissierellia bacterium]|nr:IS110 family transposase [Tissierellia bacterium]
METILEICCGLDVHRDEIVACLMKGPLDCKPISEIKTFSALQHDLKKLKKWLEKENCHHVAMESTGIYWKPVYAMLEDSFDGNIKILLVNAQRIKNVPGRKTDVKDSEWIASLLRSGLLSGSFIPEKEIRELRDLTRYRKKMVQEVSTQKNRIEKHLQSCGFKMSTFMSDVFGVSGRLIIGQIRQYGKVSVEELELLIKGTLRNKKSEIALAVKGNLNNHERNFLSMQMKHLEQLEKNVEEINENIDIYLERFAEEVKLLDGIPGISKVAAAAIIGEIGTDMSKFPKVGNICSWAGLTPGCNESAGRKKSTKTRHGNPYIKSILCEVAWTVTRKKGTYLSNWYWKVKQRRGGKKAIIGLARKILIIIYTMLKDNQVYKEERFKEVQMKHEEKREKKLIQELKKRGFKVEPQIA